MRNDLFEIIDAWLIPALDWIKVGWDGSLFWNYYVYFYEFFFLNQVSEEWISYKACFV